MSKETLYRWWHSKSERALNVLAERGRQTFPLSTPDAATWANVGLCALPEASGSSCALQRPFCVCGSLPGWAGGARWYEPRSPMRLPTSSLLPKTVAASLFAATWANVSARPADVGPEEGA